MKTCKTWSDLIKLAVSFPKFERALDCCEIIRNSRRMPSDWIFLANWMLNIVDSFEHFFDWYKRDADGNLQS